MSNRNPSLDIEPSERRALGIMALAHEQAEEIAKLQAELDDMTKRCRAAEMRTRSACAALVVGFPLQISEQEGCPTELGRAFARDMALSRTLKS